MDKQETNDSSARPLDLADLPEDLSEALSCCCNLFDHTMQPLKHLDDCDLRLDQNENTDNTTSEELCDETTGIRFGHPRTMAQKQSHRESMARLRQKLRDSIIALQTREKELEQALRETVTSRPPNRKGADSSSSTDQLRHAYVDLVREQLDLQDEQHQLKAARALREAYERLVAREMDKTRTFEVHPPQP
jgi:hypothetical protein